MRVTLRNETQGMTIPGSGESIWSDRLRHITQAVADHATGITDDYVEAQPER